MRTKQNELYEAPQMSVVELRYEGIICTSSAKGGDSCGSSIPNNSYYPLDVDPFYF